jgi:spoIIIJ-associated protein
MREYIDVTGKTEDEAIRKALEQLGLDRDDVSVEILERAKSGFLGLGSCPAKVRVSYGPEEEESAPVVEVAPVVEQPKPVEKKAEKPVRKEKKKEPRKETVKETVKEEAPEMPAADLGDEVNDEKAEAIRKFLTGLLEQMGNEADIHVYQPEKGRYKVILEGKNMGALIGRRGETLDAIQQLTSYSVNRTGGRVRIQLDAENYREKRIEALRALSNRVANNVVKSRRSFTFEPMTAYERRVIHATLQDNDKVTTYSIGHGIHRKGVVA